jgi:hypothetical protein
MKQWDKWKCLWTAMATAQLVEMVLDPNYRPQAGEEKLHCQQLTYVYKVLLDTVLESSLIAILHWGDTDTVLKMWEEMVSKADDNFRMNTSYGRYGAAYNMVGFSCFNEELSLLPKNPTEAKLQAMNTRGESTEPTKGVMKHTYKAVLYNYCLMQYCCILFYQLVHREGCNPNQREKVSKSMNSSSSGNR